MFSHSLVSKYIEIMLGTTPSITHNLGPESRGGQERYWGYSE